MTASAPGSPAAQSSLSEFRADARAWLAQADVPTPSGDYERDFHAAWEWQKVLYQAGWIGIDWPEEVGGRGLTMSHTLTFLEELGRARAPFPAGTIGLDVVGPTILSHGTPEQRSRFLPPLLAGEELWCQGFSEPEAGSDLASLRTRAIRDGDELVVNGQKVWTSWGTHARWCAVLVRTDPDAPSHKGISYLLVDTRSPGVTVRPIVQITGDPEFNEIFFEDVRVPVENVLGGFGNGWKLAMDTLGHERSGYAIRRRGENEAAFVDLVDQLRASGAGGDDAVAAEIGRLFVSLKAFAALGAETARRLTEGDVPTPLDSVDKLTLTATEQDVYRTACELLGPQRMAGDAVEHGLDADRWLRGLFYARAASVYGGSSQIQRTLVAERLLGLPRSR